jgi:MinD-like ATPase involved in chromosome partitioning or flagellar assembly
MSIVTFCGTGKEQVGKTLSLVAVATNMAIEHNKKILIISASYNNDTIKNCYWGEANPKKGLLFKHENQVSLDNGIEGLAKIIKSNKMTSEAITDYTKIVFKNRLEILLGFEQFVNFSEEEIGKTYADIIKLADEYYDIVFVDLDNELDKKASNEILEMSDIVILTASQKIKSINALKKLKIETFKKKCMFLIGKYDRKSKFTIKNLTRYLGEKKEILAIPYNTLFFEAAEEANVPDLFLKLRNIKDQADENYYFVNQIKKVSEEILNKIHERLIF